jgi:AbrB family looped-hinge helix DNA binding protein
MNVHATITDASDGNMTSKGQVLIPKAVRERVGLAPGAPVTVGVNDRGEAVVLPRTQEETVEERYTRIRAAIDRVAGTRDFGFATTDEYMDYIRPWRNDPL